MLDGIEGLSCPSEPDFPPLIACRERARAIRESIAASVPLVVLDEARNWREASTRSRPCYVSSPHATKTVTRPGPPGSTSSTPRSAFLWPSPPRIFVSSNDAPCSSSGPEVARGRRLGRTLPTSGLALPRVSPPQPSKVWKERRDLLGLSDHSGLEERRVCGSTGRTCLTVESSAELGRHQRRTQEPPGSRIVGADSWAC